MFLIVGLGNPGRQYEHTRHNAGFDVMDALAEKYNISISESGHKALFGKGMIGGQKVILAKPQTFMNLSGESVAELLRSIPRRSFSSFLTTSAWHRGTSVSAKKGAPAGIMESRILLQ